MTNRGLIALVVAAVIAVLVALLLQQPKDETSITGGRYFGDLLQNVNEVAKVIIKSKSGSVTLAHADNDWRVVEKANYPAAIDKARGVVLGLARLEKVEPKTSNPDLYEKLGVQGANEPGTTPSTLIQLIDKQGKDLAVAIIGKRTNVSGKPEVSQIYIRRPNEPQTWLVEGSLPQAGPVTEWLRQELLDIEALRVRQVRVKHSDGEVLTVERTAPAKPDYVLRELDPGESVESQYSINRIANSFRELRLSDVIPADKAPAAKEGEGTTVAELITFDGLRIKLMANRDGDTIYARLSAAFDQELPQTGSANPAEESSTEKTEPKSTENKATTVPKLQNAEQTRAEAEQLQKHWRAWVYTIPAYQFENMTVKKKDLLKSEKTDDPVQTEPEKNGESGKKTGDG